MKRRSFLKSLAVAAAATATLRWTGAEVVKAPKWAATLTDFDEALKEFYAPRLAATIKDSRVLMQKYADLSAAHPGRQAVVKINIREDV